MSLYRKYRPQRFKDLVNQEHVKKTLLTALKRNQINHAYLFAGPRGTGKTTVARILAKALNCPNRNPEPCNRCFSCKEHAKLSSLDLIEIDAASNRGIDEIRELRERIKLAPSSSAYKVFIIDEVHMLTMEAFNALLKTLEEPPAHAIFILATTEAHKIPATVLSRCQRFDFIPLSISDIVARIKKISHLEKIKFEDDALRMIAAAAGGGMRDAISILDQLSSIGKKVNVVLVQETLGVVPERAVIKLFAAIIDQDLNASFDALAKISAKGYNFVHFRKTLLDFLRTVLVYKMSGQDIELKEKYSKEIYLKIIDLSQKIEISPLIKIIKVIARDSLIEKDDIPSLGFEIALVELIDEEKETSKNYCSNEATYNSREMLRGEVRTKESLNSRPSISAAGLGSSNSNHDNFNKKWQNFLEAIKPHNHSLAAILSSARLIGADQEQFLIEVDYDFHRKKIEDKINMQAIEESLMKSFNKNIKLNCRVGKPQESRKSLQDIALEVFE